MKTYCAKKETVQHDWYIVDASQYNFGRLSSEIAVRLRGKHKPQYTPHVDTGDFVVVINTDKLCTTGKKLEQKKYYSHSMYPGNLKTITLRHLIEKDSRQVIMKAVNGMLPKGPLGRVMLKKLKVYKDDNHPHGAQSPQKLEF